MVLSFGAQRRRCTLNSTGISANPGILYAPGPVVHGEPVWENRTSSRVYRPSPWIKAPSILMKSGKPTHKFKNTKKSLTEKSPLFFHSIFQYAASVCYRTFKTNFDDSKETVAWRWYLFQCYSCNRNTKYTNYFAIRYFTLTWPMSIAGLRLVPTSITISVRSTCWNIYIFSKNYKDTTIEYQLIGQSISVMRGKRLPSVSESGAYV